LIGSMPLYITCFLPTNTTSALLYLCVSISFGHLLGHLIIFKIMDKLHWYSQCLVKLDSFYLISTNNTSLQNSQNNSHTALKIDLSDNYFGVEYELFWSIVNYFDHFGSRVFFLKIGYAKYNFTINLGALV
jgi:hypothetical protein